MFALPAPIDNVLKIFGARIAKVNPLTVELDLGMKVDLGVVRIDKFKVKIPVDPFGVPTILPSGISIDVSNVLVGSGFVNIIEPPAAAPPRKEQPGFGGIEGAFDISLVPIKLRIAASFGVRPIEDTATGRKATAVFLGRRRGQTRAASAGGLARSRRRLGRRLGVARVQVRDAERITRPLTVRLWR